MATEQPNHPWKPELLPKPIYLFIMAPRLVPKRKSPEEATLAGCPAQRSPRLACVSVLSLVIKSYHTSHCAKCKNSTDKSGRGSYDKMKLNRVQTGPE